MRCYYEVLGVEQDADNNDIKKAYYKLSLKWHPDKNTGKEAEVKEIFQNIQEAYKVLSDAHERAFYDKHRDRILQGGLGQSNDYKDDKFDIYPYYTASCYSGYGDDDKGFYTVYRNVFENIANEERNGLPPKERPNFNLPSFGQGDSDYDEVVALFYAKWEGFVSRKSYAWVEKHDIREAPSRPVRRAMEAENKKLRDAAKRERQEEIRELVAFVRKRDKRVQARRQAMEQQAAEKVKKAKIKAQQARQRAAEALQAEIDQGEAEWSSMATLEAELQKLEDDLNNASNSSPTQIKEEISTSEEVNNQENEDDIDEDPDSVFCPACNKLFRSDKAFANHEKSKKHKQKLELLREQLLEDEQDVDDDDDV